MCLGFLGRKVLTTLQAGMPVAIVRSLLIIGRATFEANQVSFVSFLSTDIFGSVRTAQSPHKLRPSVTVKNVDVSKF